MNIIEQRPLNPLQRAYLMGRNGSVPLGGVAMHDLREFACDFTPEELEATVRRMAERHPVLRSFIDENTFEQKVLADVVLNIEVIDLTAKTAKDAQQEVDNLRQRYLHTILPLDQPLWRMRLIQLPKELSKEGKPARLFISFDGLTVDGYAISVLLNELFNPEYEFKPASSMPPTSYFDKTPADEAYWLAKLDEVQETVTLPWKRDLEGINASTYKREGIVIPHTAWQSILSLGAKSQLLPNSVLTTALFEVVSLWANENYLLLSMPISNSIVQPKLGNHSSFIVVNYDANGEQDGFVAKAKSVQKDVLEAMSHTTFSGVELGKTLVKKTAKLVTLPVTVTNGLSWGTDDYQRAEYLGGITQTPQLGLDIRIHQRANKDIAIDFDYAEEALPAIVVTQMLHTLKQHLLDLSQAATLDDVSIPRLCVGDSLKGTYQEKSIGKEAENAAATVEDYLAQIKANLYGKQTTKAALIYDDKAISYQELGVHVAKVAAQLMALNLNKGDDSQLASSVAICLPKGPEHVAVTLACSLTNIIWLPVDMTSPDERIQYIVNNSRADLIITDRELAASIKGDINTLQISDILSNQNLADTLDYDAVFDGEPGYYLYTSGSTGMPKCVVMNHRATANVVEITNKRWELTEEDVLFAATPFHHDMSVYELFAAMSLGSTLVVPTPDQAKSAVDWARMVEQYKVSVWSSVPAIVDMLLTCAEPKQIQSLKLVSQGGDYVKPTVIDKLRSYVPHARLFSIGGPTETTIWNIWNEISSEDTDVMPYGYDVDNNRCYIMNDKGQHCPNYVVGTICASGVNLSNGYLKDGEINQNDFTTITTPEGEQVRVFTTSDQGYFREDGKIIFAGRKAGYLKVRGVRMASAEVELAMTKHPAIWDTIAMACVNPQYNVSELVVAYVVEKSVRDKNQDVSTNELRQFLQKSLPASHIPSRWLPLESFPLTRNKKVDRKRLNEMAEQQLYQQYTGAQGARAAQAIKTPTAAKTPIAKSPSNGASSELERTVLKVFSDITQEPLTSLNGETPVLSLGLRPKQLGEIAKALSEETKLNVTLFNLAKASTISEVVEIVSA